MKTVKLKSSILAGLATLCIAFSSFGKDSLKDITKPYLGEYECKNATLGNENILEKFSYIRLELKSDGEYLLSYQTEEGEKGLEKGKYTYDKERGTLSLYFGESGKIKQTFPIEKGKILVERKIGKKMLVIEFEQK